MKIIDNYVYVLNLCIAGVLSNMNIHLLYTRVILKKCAGLNEIFLIWFDSFWLNHLIKNLQLIC